MSVQLDHARENEQQDFGNFLAVLQVPLQKCLRRHEGGGDPADEISDHPLAVLTHTGLYRG